MFSRKKIAAVSALLGGLAVTCAGATQAYAGGNAGNCTRDTTGNISCLQGNENGGYAVRQSQDCSSMKPMAWPSNGLLNTGSTQVGPTVSCSNTAPLPEPNQPPAPQVNTAPAPEANTAPAPDYQLPQSGK